MTPSLPDLLEAWRVCRDPELADRIDALDAWTSAEPIVPIQASDAEHHAAWLGRARSADPREFRALRRGLWPGTASGLTEVIAAFVRWPADPRVARLFAQAVRDRPLRARAARGPLSQALAHLQAIDDARVLRWLPQPGDPQLEPALSAVWSWFAGRAPTRLTHGERVRWRLDVALPPPVGPGPDGPPEDPDALAVMSDALQGRGDPLGLVWALQRDGSRASRAQADGWVRRYGWWWTPSALRVAVPGSVAFERGRVRGLALDGDQLPWASRTFDHPAWRGVTEVVLRGAAIREPELLLRLPSLAFVRADGVHPGMLDRLRTSFAPNITVRSHQ